MYKKLNCLNKVFNQNETRTAFSILKSNFVNNQKLEKVMQKLDDKLSVNLKRETFAILKLLRQSVVWSERLTKNDSNILNTHDINSAQKSNTFDENDTSKGTLVEHVTKNRNFNHHKMRSITYYQRQDLYNKENNIEYANVDYRNHYKVIAPIKTAYNFEKNQEAYSKIENSVVERLEKSYNMDTMLKSNKPERKKPTVFNPRIAKFVKKTQKIASVDQPKSVEIQGKDENYLLNEIIEHIMQTNHKSKVQWDKIRPTPDKKLRNYSNDFHSVKKSYNHMHKNAATFKRCQSTSQIQPFGITTPVIKRTETVTDLYQGNVNGLNAYTPFLVIVNIEDIICCSVSLRIFII